MNHVYDILDTLKNELRATKQVNTVTFGSITEADLDKTTIFPLSHIVMGDARHLGNVIEFNIRIIMADVVDESNFKEKDDDFYGNNNMQDVLNSQFEVGNRIVSKLKRGDLFNSRYQVIGDPSLEPFMDRFSNVLTGWELNMDVQIPNDMSIC